MAKLNGTSFPEQCLYYYVLKYFPDAMNRTKITGSDGKTKMEADIYIPSLKVAIEYDGQYWHQNKTEQDNQKSEFFGANGIFLIRIRAANLPTIENPNGIVLIHGISEKDGQHLHDIIEKIIRLLGSKCGTLDKRKQLQTYSLSFEQYVNQLPMVIANLYDKPCESNVCSVKDACVYTCWDYEKNLNANPEYIPHNLNCKMWFKCPSGYSFRGYSKTNPKNKKNCDQNCSVCAYNICPFLSQCIPLSPGFERYYYLPNTSVCPAIHDFFMKYLNGDVQWPQKFGSQLLYYIDCSNSTLYSDILHMLVSPKVPQETKSRIKHMFESTSGEKEDGYVKLLTEMEKKLLPDIIPAIIRLQVTTKEDLDLCKAIIMETQWVVLICFSAFDATEESRKQAYDYLAWLIDYYRDNQQRVLFYMSHFSAGTQFAAAALSVDFYKYLCQAFIERGYSPKTSFSRIRSACKDRKTIASLNAAAINNNNHTNDEVIKLEKRLKEFTNEINTCTTKRKKEIVAEAMTITARLKQLKGTR